MDVFKVFPLSARGVAVSIASQPFKVERSPNKPFHAQTYVERYFAIVHMKAKIHIFSYLIFYHKSVVGVQGRNGSINTVTVTVIAVVFDIVCNVRIVAVEKGMIEKLGERSGNVGSPLLQQVIEPKLIQNRAIPDV